MEQDKSKTDDINIDIDLIRFSPPELKDRVKNIPKEEIKTKLNPPELSKRIKYISQIKIDFWRKIGST